MIQGLFSVEEVIAMIEKGDTLLLAGDSPLLSTLPKGKWIAGVTNQFIEKGKALMSSREKIFVHNMTNIAVDVKFEVYDASTMHRIYDDAFDNGFSVLIIPFHSDAKNEYALNCVDYSNFANRPVCGWASATPFFTGDSRDVSIVFSGESGLSYDEAGVVMHIALPPEKYAELHTFNPYIPVKGDVIQFEENGALFENVLVNGVRQNFRQYMIDQKIDRSPKTLNVLVGDYAGILINTVIFPELENADEKTVTLGNPVFKEISYSFAQLNAEESYKNMQQIDNEIVFSFSCVANYEFPDDFVKYLTHTDGPFVFGEFAYFLLNNTTVYVTVGNVK